MVKSMVLCYNWMKKRINHSILSRERTTIPKKIIDLGIDRIEKLMQVPLELLITAADANKYLKEAAEISFVQRFGEMTIELNRIKNPENCRISENMHISSSRIQVMNVNIALQLIRFFGHLIRKLHVTDEYSNNRNARIYKPIFRHINKYCTKSLVELKFNMIPKNQYFKLLKKPFVNIKSVEFFSCYLDEKVKPLNVLFPNIQSLTIDSTDFIDFQCVEQNFPNLEQLSLTTSRENVIQMLRFNPQIKEFSTKCICDVKLLRFFSLQLTDLEALDIVLNCDELDSNDFPTSSFDNVKKLSLNFSHSKRSFPNIPLEFPQLKELSVWTNHSLGIEFQKFIMDHSSRLTQLNMPLVSTQADKINEEEIEFLKELNSLEELNLSRFKFSTNQSIEMFNMFDKLKSFNFAIESKREYLVLISKANLGWNVCKKHGYRDQIEIKIERTE